MFDDFKTQSELSINSSYSILPRAKNKLDGCEYAIKKIILKYCDSELFAKIFREVTTLARLAHPNVVCYKASNSNSPTVSYSAHLDRLK